MKTSTTCTVYSKINYSQNNFDKLISTEVDSSYENTYKHLKHWGRIETSAEWFVEDNKRKI